MSKKSEFSFTRDKSATAVFLKGLSHEIDFKNFDKKLNNLAKLSVAAGFWIF